MRSLATSDMTCCSIARSARARTIVTATRHETRSASRRVLVFYPPRFLSGPAVGAESSRAVATECFVAADAVFERPTPSLPAEA